MQHKLSFQAQKEIFALRQGPFFTSAIGKRDAFIYNLSMRIAILGGAFDPPHIGHYLVAIQVKELLSMDEVWLMPLYRYFPEFPVKFSHITAPAERFEMVKTLEKYGLRVSDFEFSRNKESRTIDTLRLLHQEYPQHTFHWIIGSDTLPTFHLWNEWEKLVRDENLIVFPRDTDFKTLEERVLASFRLAEIPPNITIAEGSLIVSNIASTHIRKRVRSGLPVTRLVNPEVEEFIKSHRLYR